MAFQGLGRRIRIGGMAAQPTVCVITATTGHPGLGKCIRSVQEQSYASIEHLVVIDGPEWEARADAILGGLSSRRGLKVIRLPHATGRDTWNGHRIYGAMPMVVLTDYVCWLDEDNWFDADHVETMVAAARGASGGWAFALRKIVDTAGEFVTLDQCESLGPLHPSFMSPQDYHIDTSCYLVRRDIAVQLTWVWNRIARPPQGQGPGPDRLLCHILMQHFPAGGATRRYTVNYTVGSTGQSVKAEFFLYGNNVMRQRYPQGLPWEG
jgi:glycosyltransferase involved in cell wall biosynthesis